MAYAEYTVATKPAAAAYTGYAFITDDNGGTLWHSDGIATWRQQGPGLSQPSGVEIAGVEITANTANFSTAGFADVTGLGGLIVPIQTRPYKVEFEGLVSITTGILTGGIAVDVGFLDDLGVMVCRRTLQIQVAAASSQILAFPFTMKRRLAANVAQRTYKIQAAVTSSGSVATAKFLAAAGTSGATGYSPCRADAITV